MYARKTKHKTHKKYTIEEKNQIVLLYLDQHMRVSEIVRTFDLNHRKTLHVWLDQFQRYGTCIDNRGKNSTGRPKKIPERPLEDYSKQELIERCRMLEDIKKSFAYLENQKQKKNIKS